MYLVLPIVFIYIVVFFIAINQWLCKIKQNTFKFYRLFIMSTCPYLQRSRIIISEYI